VRYRKLDPNNDYTFGHGGSDYLVDSAQTVAQLIFTTLRLLLGEWFLDTTKGVPWLTQVVGRNHKDAYDQIIKSTIKGVQGVVDLTDYSSTLDPGSRTLTINQATVITVYGTVNLQNISAIGGYGQSAYGRKYGG
jgi:hypothetical protein